MEELPLRWKRNQLYKESSAADEFLQKRRQRYLDRSAVIKDWPSWRRDLNEFVRENKWFERFIFFIIALNCVTISTQNFSSLEAYQDAIAIIEDFFTCIFFVEMVIKMLGLGVFVRRGGYFHSAWNSLDFIIVTVSVVAMIFFHVEGGQTADVGFTAARSFRLLRPLRTLSVLTSLRTILRAIMVSLGRLFNVVLLTVVFTVAMGLIGLEEFKGVLRYRCFNVETVLRTDYGNDEGNSTATTKVTNRTNIANKTGIELLDHYEFLKSQIPDSPVCAWSGKVPIPTFPDTETFYEHPMFDGALLKELHDTPAQSDVFVCPWATHCLKTENPGKGYLKFDDILSTVTTLYSIVSLEDWATVMYLLMDAKGWFVTWYFMVLVVVGTIFILNLALAIISDSFNRINTLEKQAAAGNKELNSDNVAADKPNAENEVLAWSGMIVSPQLESAAADSRCVTMFAPVRRFVFKNITSKAAFGYLTSFIALANAAMLACVHHGMPQELSSAILISNTVFTALFAVEIILKLVAEPVKDLIKDPLNVFDVIVTLLALLELIVTKTAYMSIFRCIRLFRVLQLSQSLSLTIKTLIGAWKATLSLVLLLVILIFLFALLGMQLFSEKMCDMDTTSPSRVNTSVCDNVPRTNFDNVGYGVVTTFIIVAGDGWRKIMFDGMDAVGEYSAIYFCLCFLIGGYLMLNLFVAVLLASKEEEPELVMPAIIRDTPTDGLFIEHGVVTDEMTFEMANQLDDAAAGGESRRKASKAPSSAMSSAGLNSGLLTEPTLEGFDMLSNMESRSHFYTIQESRQSLKQLVEDLEAEKALPRRIAGKIVKHPAFIIVVVGTITFSMVTLMLNKPLEPPVDNALYDFNEIADLICGGIFVVEAFLKMLYLGLWNRPVKGFGMLQKGYFQKRWNIFDFLLMLCGLVPFIGFFYQTPQMLAIVKGFRLTRGFRPLSLIGRHQGLTVVFRSLINSMPSIRNVTCIAILVWLVYAILGTSLFSGTMYACTELEWGDVSYTGLEITNRTSCLEKGYNWTTPDQNFDHVGNSLVTLFQVATVDNWFDVMFRGVDAVNFDNAPRANHQPLMILYFVSYIIFMSFFLLNFFVSVMVETYFVTKSKIEANILHTLTGSERILSPEQRDYLRMFRRALLFIKPPLHINVGPKTLRGQLRRLIRHHMFDKVYLTLAVLHVAVMGSEHAEEPPVLPQTLFIVDGVMTGIFCISTLTRVYVIGPVNFLLDQKRNITETLVNLITLSAIIAQAIVGENLVCELLRNFRMVRLYRILFINANMRLLVETLKFSASSFVYVFFILFLLFFTYAVVGMAVFGRVKQDPRVRGGISPYVNFERFDTAMLTLLRISTVDEWDSVMWSCAIEAPDCDPNIGECGSKVGSIFFFISFVVLGNWIGINFFTAVLMESFSNAEKEERFAIQQEDVVRFQQLWKEYADEYDDNVMPIGDLLRFVLRLGGPLGPNIDDDEIPNFKMALKLVSSLNIKAHGNHVSQQSVFDSLVRHFYGVTLPTATEYSLVTLINERFEFKQFERCSPMARKKNFTLKEAVGAVVIQAAWRGQRMRKVVDSAVKKHLAEKNATKMGEQLQQRLKGPPPPPPGKPSDAAKKRALTANAAHLQVTGLVGDRGGSRSPLLLSSKDDSALPHSKPRRPSIKPRKKIPLSEEEEEALLAKREGNVGDGGVVVNSCDDQAPQILTSTTASEFSEPCNQSFAAMVSSPNPTDRPSATAFVATGQGREPEGAGTINGHANGEFDDEDEKLL